MMIIYIYIYIHTTTTTTTTTTNDKHNNSNILCIYLLRQGCQTSRKPHGAGACGMERGACRPKRQFDRPFNTEVIREAPVGCDLLSRTGSRQPHLVICIRKI